MSVKSYRDLDVWKRGMDISEAVYKLTKGFPREELYGLTSQMRRSAVSIPANIAEGWGRSGTVEFLQFLRIAQGSMRELETFLMLAVRIELAREAETAPILESLTVLAKQLTNLQRTLNNRRNS